MPGSSSPAPFRGSSLTSLHTDYGFYSSVLFLSSFCEETGANGPPRDDRWPEPGVGSFLEVQDKTLLYETNLAWKDKIPQLFWRGALMVDLRKEFWEIARKYQWGEFGMFRRAIVGADGSQRCGIGPRLARQGHRSVGASHAGAALQVQVLGTR